MATLLLSAICAVRGGWWGKVERGTTNDSERSWGVGWEASVERVGRKGSQAGACPTMLMRFAEKKQRREGRLRTSDELWRRIGG